MKVMNHSNNKDYKPTSLSGKAVKVISSKTLWKQKEKFGAEADHSFFLVVLLKTAGVYSISVLSL